MSIVQDFEVANFLNLTDEDDITLVLAVRDSVESWIQGYCRRTFESTSYTLEKYNGTGSKYLYLRHYPVTALYRLVSGTIDVIRIKNTSDYTTASVSVTSTGIVLEKDGTTDSTILFASYTTMATVAAAISAINGWSATVTSTTYNSYKSNSLLESFGQNCIDDNEVYLSMPNTALDGFEVNPTNGTIYYPGGFPRGFNNIFVTYTAGYSTTTMPDDLKHAILMTLDENYNKWKNDTFGLSEYTIGDLSFTFAKTSTDSDSSGRNTIAIPREAQNILGRYRRLKI